MKNTRATRSQTANISIKEVESKSNKIQANIVSKHQDCNVNLASSGRQSISKLRACSPAQLDKQATPITTSNEVKSSVTPSTFLSKQGQATSQSASIRTATRATASNRSQNITKSNLTSMELSSKRETRSSIAAAQAQAQTTTKFQQQERPLLENSGKLEISKNSKKIQKVQSKTQIQKKAKKDLKPRKFSDNDQENSQTLFLNTKGQNADNEAQAKQGATTQAPEEFVLRDITDQYVSSHHARKTQTFMNDEIQNQLELIENSNEVRQEKIHQSHSKDLVETCLGHENVRASSQATFLKDAAENELQNASPKCQPQDQSNYGSEYHKESESQLLQTDKAGRRGRGRPKKSSESQKNTGGNCLRLPMDEDLQPIQASSFKDIGDSLKFQRILDSTSINKILDPKCALFANEDKEVDEMRQDFTSNTKITNNHITSSKLIKQFEGIEPEDDGTIHNNDHSCLRIGRIGADSQNQQKTNQQKINNQKITRFEVSGSSVINNVDERDETGNQDYDAVMDEQESCLPFQVHQNDQVDLNEKFQTVQKQNLQQKQKDICKQMIKTCGEQISKDAYLNNGLKDFERREMYPNLAQTPGCKQFTLDDQEQPMIKRGDANIDSKDALEELNQLQEQHLKTQERNNGNRLYEQSVMASPMEFQQPGNEALLQNQATHSILGSSQVHRIHMSACDLQESQSKNFASLINEDMNQAQKAGQAVQNPENEVCIQMFDNENHQSNNRRKHSIDASRTETVSDNDKDDMAEMNEPEVHKLDAQQFSKKQQPSRLAREKKNSKYDESNYLVDYSGQQNKIRKTGDNDNMKSGQSTAGRLLVEGERQNQTTRNNSSAAGKRRGQAKRTKKQTQKENDQAEAQMGQLDYINKLSQDNLQIQIQQIKIDKAELTVHNQAQSSFNAYERSQRSASNNQHSDKMNKFQSLINKTTIENNQTSPALLESIPQSKYRRHLTSQEKLEDMDTIDQAGLNLNRQSTTALNNQQYEQQNQSLFDLQFGETQKNLIRHQMLNPHLYKRGPTKYQKSSNAVANGNVKAKGHWTEAEDKKLAEAVKINKGKNWKKIAEAIQGRTDVQCLHRWQKVLNPNLVKGPWTDIEDRLLLQLVNIDGPQKWTQIANHLPGRIGKQCRERWHNHLNPMIKRNATWSREEEWILFLLNRDLANKWADIANVLEGRTDNTIKNHWNSSMKRRIKEYVLEFEQLFKQVCEAKGITFEGCEPVELDDRGVAKSNPKSYSKEYIKLMKELEQQRLAEKGRMVKDQNRDYYQTKCMQLIDDSKDDSFSRAAANLMLNSSSEYLQDLRDKCGHLVAGSDLNLYNEPIINVEEHEVHAMIDKYKNQPNPSSSIVNEANMNEDPELQLDNDHGDYYDKPGIQYNVTPDQAQKLAIYAHLDAQIDEGVSRTLDQSQRGPMGGLESSAMTGMTYDKENIPQINRPTMKTKPGRPKSNKQMKESAEDRYMDNGNNDCKQFESLFDQHDGCDNNASRRSAHRKNETQGRQRQPLQPIKPSNGDCQATKGNAILKQISGGNNKKFTSPFDPTNQNSAEFLGRNLMTPLTFHQHVQLQNFQKHQQALQSKANANQDPKAQKQATQQQMFSQNQPNADKQPQQDKQQSLFTPLKQLGAHKCNNSGKDQQNSTGFGTINGQNGQSKQRATMDLSIIHTAMKAMSKSPMEGRFSVDRFMGSSSSMKNKTNNNTANDGNKARGVQQWPLAAGQTSSNEKSNMKSHRQQSRQANRNGDSRNVAPFFSAKSSKIGASIFNQSAVSVKQMNDSVQSGKQMVGDKTPPNKKNGGGGLNINAFSLAGVGGPANGLLLGSAQGGVANSNIKSNIKVPIPISIQKQSLFSAASDAKGLIRSSESYKSCAEPKQAGSYGGLTSFLQLGNNSPKNEDAETENDAHGPSASMNHQHHQHPQSMQDLCSTINNQSIALSHQMPFKQNSRLHQNSNAYNQIAMIQHPNSNTQVPIYYHTYYHDYHYHNNNPHQMQHGMHHAIQPQSCGNGCQCGHTQTSKQHNQRHQQMLPPCCYPNRQSAMIPIMPYGQDLQQAFIVQNLSGPNGQQQYLLTAKQPSCISNDSSSQNIQHPSNSDSSSDLKSRQDDSKKMDGMQTSQEKSSNSNDNALASSSSSNEKNYHQQDLNLDRQNSAFTQYKARKSASDAEGKIDINKFVANIEVEDVDKSQREGEEDGDDNSAENIQM